MPSVSEQPAPKPIPAATDPATPSNPEAAADNQPHAALLRHDCTGTEAQPKDADARLRQETSTAAQSGPGTPEPGFHAKDAARLGHAATLAQRCSSFKQPAHHAVTCQAHVSHQATASPGLIGLVSQLADTQQHATETACVTSVKPQTAEPVGTQSVSDATLDNGAHQQWHDTSKGLQADRDQVSTALPTQHSSSQRQRPVMSTVAPQQQTLTKAVSANVPFKSFNAPQTGSVSVHQIVSVEASQRASGSAQQTASVSAQQTAAEMLQWLDATLAAKKPAALKV